MADMQSIFKTMIDGFANGIDKIAKDIQNLKEQTEEDNKPQVLTAEKLLQLRWMSPSQLAAIYRYGKVKTHISDDPDAYRMLRWMTESQLQAIFGKDGMNQ